MTVRREEPFDALTEKADDMLRLLDGSGIQAIVMLTNGEDNGIGLTGWDEDVEAITYMFIHLQAIMRASGKEMRIMTEEGVFIDGE